MASIPHNFAAFLVDSKRRTYAGLDDEATVAAPLLRSSKQLEHRAPPYAYRDIYFGMGFFVGQETVSRDDRVIWSMSYSGGVRAEIMDRDVFLAIYKFLRQALQAVSVEEPYRGRICLSRTAWFTATRSKARSIASTASRRSRGRMARSFTSCAMVVACCDNWREPL
jgi:hypothetical protein